MWENSAITNAGKALLASWVAGTTLTITGATGGTGTVPPEAILAQTALVNQKQTFDIIGEMPVSNGRRFQIQITAHNTSYTLNQIGIWAKIGSGSPVLLALFQDAAGITIPAQSEMPDFVYTFYALLEMSNTGTLEVNINTSAVVSREEFDAGIAPKLDKTGDGKDLTVTFTEAANRQNIGTGETLAVMFGKIKKFFADLKTVAFSGKLADLTDDSTHRTVTDEQIAAWNGKQDALGYTPVPDTRKVNGKALSADITLTAADVGAATSNHGHGAITNDGKIGTQANNAIYTGSSGMLQAGTLPIAAGGTGANNAQNALANLGGVPTTRKINNKALSDDISLTATDVGAIPVSLKGVAYGVAELDETGKVPSSQLPSYVDDVLEYTSMSAFPATGETGKIYVALDTNKTYRWSGSSYVEISPSIALGETASTAYRGDRGKIAYDHSQTTGNPHGTTPADIGAVPTTRKINGKSLTADVSLSATDVGAAAASHTHTKSQISDFPASMIPTAHASTHKTGGSDALTPADIGAATSGHTHSDYMPKSGGTFTGIATAQSNTSYTTPQIRNVVLSTSAPSGGNNGEIWIKYL